MKRIEFFPKKRRSYTRRRWLFLETLQPRIALDASLSGYAFIDADGDGTCDTGELGVPGSVITLSGRTSAGVNVSRSTLSKNDGSYTFSSVAAGTYQLTQQQPKALVDGRDSTLVSAALTSNDVISNIVVTDGQHLVHNDFGEQHLRPEFINVTWLFASAPSMPELLRRAVARGEELAGDTALASAIRTGQNDLPGGTNTAPTAVSDSFATLRNQVLNVLPASGVLKNDTDPQGNALAAQLVASPGHGTLNLNANGGFSYTPNANYHGSDSFTYKISDGSLTSNIATVTITINEPAIDAEAAPDFTLIDVNPNSATHNEGVSPRDYLEQVSGWYFGHST